MVIYLIIVLFSLKITFTMFESHPKKVSFVFKMRHFHSHLYFVVHWSCLICHHRNVVIFQSSGNFSAAYHEYILKKRQSPPVLLLLGQPQAFLPEQTFPLDFPSLVSWNRNCNQTIIYLQETKPTWRAAYSSPNFRNSLTSFWCRSSASWCFISSSTRRRSPSSTLGSH